MDSPWTYSRYDSSSACEVAPGAYERLDSDRYNIELAEILKCTADISDLPYDPEPWLCRGRSLRLLGCPELALGDVYKARLLTEAALENCSALGDKAILTFGMKMWYRHMTDPAWQKWKAMIAGPGMLETRVTEVLKQLELQIWNELMEGLMAANCCMDYLVLSRESVKRFPDDQVFPSEVANAESWLKQREDILQTHLEEGKISEEKMQTTLHNGGVYVTAYPWMTDDLLSRDEPLVQTLKKEFALNSTNCTVAQSTFCKVPDSIGSMTNIDVLGVVALEDITTGTTVLTDSTTAGVVTASNRCPTCCNSTTANTTNACCDVLYCSQACAKTALQTFHPPLCGKDFTFLYEAAQTAEQTTDISLDSLLLLRVLALSIHDSTSHPLRNSLLARLTPTYDMKQLIIFNFPDHIATPIKILQELDIDIFANADYDTWVIHTIRCRLQNNKHGQTLDGLLGTAVNPLYSMFNHSCSPNVDWEHEENNTTLRLFSVRDVKKGEECFISYIQPWDMEYQDRQEALRPWLGVECGCTRCVAERPEEEEEEEQEAEK